MNKTNKATTTTMVRRASAALLAVCIATVHLAMPVKAATAFTTQQITGYYPDVLPYSPIREYTCRLGGTDQSMFADMSFGNSAVNISLSGVFYVVNPNTGSTVSYLANASGSSSIGKSHSIPDITYAEGWRYVSGMSDYYIRANIIASLSV